MINQQLLDYIRQQIQQGVSREQITNSLAAQGWRAQDIEEGFNSVNVPNIPRVYSTVPTVASSSSWKIVAGIVIGVAILGGGAYMASQTIFKPAGAPQISDEILNQLPPETTTPQQPPEQPAIPTQPQSPEMVFADKLSSCTKHKMTFTHPLTGDMLEREILGIINGKCNYIEQMPNDGKMECKYSESERMTMAQFYKDLAGAETAGIRLRLGGEEQSTTYLMDGKVVDNPLQEVLSSGTCVVSGY